jgi:electron transfer flavoprotein beta subunit
LTFGLKNKSIFMKILVAVKRVVDAYVKVQVLADHSGVDTHNVKMAINPFCEIAVEEAVRLKEQGIATEVVVVSVAEQAAQEQLRTALALGADRAVLVETAEALEPLGVAKVLQAIVVKESPQLVILGKQSIDGDNNQTGQMLAALCQWPQGTFISKLVVEDTHLLVTREVDSGLQTLKLNLPALVTTDLRLNEPRYVTLPNIMQAKRKPIDVIPVADLGLNLAPRLTCVQVTPPDERKAGIMVASVAELVDKLRNEAKVIP